jgi:hypothetical protein
MKISLIVAGVVLAIVAIGLVVLAGTDIPAPSGRIEKTIPADRLPH